MDRAIAASTATQLIRFLTGPVTMLLIIRYLSPYEQGFFYSFAGVVGIQVFLEAGFAQSITQFSSREFAHLRFNRQGMLTGKPEALSRLRSIIHKANRYYLAMATVLTVALAIGGYFFFSSKPDHGVPWLVPWIVVSVCAGVSFLLTPIWALLEGCNRVTDIATYRFCLTLVGFATTAICLSLGLGIGVASWTAVVTLVVPVAYLFARWRKLIAQILLRPPGEHKISWKNEIWGFQWRIAGTWMSRYFVESGIAPLSFYLLGPVEAGRIGMSFQVVRMIVGISSSWTIMKIPHWGALSAQGRGSLVEQEWLTNARKSWGICLLGMLCFMAALAILEVILPSVASRFSPFSHTLGFVVGWSAYAVWLSCSHYTRALRREPFTLLHASVGLAFLGGCVALSHFWGAIAIPWVFAVVHFPPLLLAMRIRRLIRDEIVSC